VFAEGAEVPVLAGTCSLPTEDYASTCLRADRTGSVSWALQFARLAVTPLLAGACRRSVFVEVAAAVAGTHLAVLNRTLLVA